jgi:hypothetical protein
MKASRCIALAQRCRKASERIGPASRLVSAIDAENERWWEMAVAMGIVLGFIAGLFSFRAKRRWCPDCGGLTQAEVGRGPA